MMKAMRKTYLSAAMAAALATVGASSQVGAVNLSQDNIGDVGLVEYYTVRDGWTTEFNLINTSDSTVAVKVRFHEGRNSREVLDFIAVLSPFDQLLGILQEDPNDPNGTPILRFPDQQESSCLVPIPTGRNVYGGQLRFSDRGYTGGRFDGFRGDNTIDRSKEGYVTFIMMGAAPPGAENNPSQIVPYNSKHVNGVPRDCLAVENAFRDANIVRTYGEFERNVNALKLSYSLTNVARGVQGASSATMLANFATDESFIAHTRTSIRAQGGVVAQRQVAVDQARAALNSATAAVTSVEAALIQLNCGFIAGQLPVPNTCPSPLATSYNSALAAQATAQVAFDQAEADLNDALGQLLAAPRNLIHSQDRQGDQFPTLNSGDFFSTWLVDGNYKHPATTLEPNQADGPGILPPPFNRYWFGIYARPVDAVTALLMKSDAINEWAVNPNTGASTDMVLTAPTKRFYTDWLSVYAQEPHLTGISPIVAGVVANSTTGWPPFSSQFWTLGQACDMVGLDMWNVDEVPLIDPVLPSPRAQLDLCWETNVLYTGAESMLRSRLGERLPVEQIAAAPRINGWVQIKMDMLATQYHPAIPLLNITYPFFADLIGSLNGENGFGRVVQTGMPYIGFTFKERNMGQAASYGAIMPHSYLRNWTERNWIGGTIVLTDPNLIPILSGPIFPDTFPNRGNPLN